MYQFVIFKLNKMGYNMKTMKNRNKYIIVKKIIKILWQNYIAILNIKMKIINTYYTKTL